MNRATQFLSTHFCKVPELSVSSRFLSWSTEIGDIILNSKPTRVCFTLASMERFCIIIISFCFIVEQTHIQSALSDAVCPSNFINFTFAKLTTINFDFIKLMVIIFHPFKTSLISEVLNQLSEYYSDINSLKNSEIIL